VNVLGTIVEEVIGIIIEWNLIPEIKVCGLDSLIYNRIHWGLLGTRWPVFGFHKKQVIYGPSE